MKNKRWHSYIWMILCMAILLLVMPVSGTAQAQEGNGYWELISVDVEKYAYRLINSEYYFHNISRDGATCRYETPGEVLQTSMTWTEPEQRYTPGQSVDLTISVKTDEFICIEDREGGSPLISILDPDNHIYVEIWEPWDPNYRLSRNYLLTDPQGEYLAKIEMNSEANIINESQTLHVSREIPFKSNQTIYIVTTAGHVAYNYQWVEDASVNPLTPNPASEGSFGRTIVIVGIAITGTLGVIAGELANRAAQAAESGQEERPEEEPVYVLNPSHKLFNLKVNQPVTLNVNGYRVTPEGHQIEKGALISIGLPPDMADYFSLQTTGSDGQVSCIITLLKIPSASSATLDVNGVFPKGKANTQVQLAINTKFSISPVDTPKITFYEKDKQWRAPELIAAFRDTEQNTPVKVGFNYVFDDPPLTFKPDILEVKEGYSSDEGLTYNFKLNVKDGIDLEEIFGEDLTEDDGRVMVDVVVKDESGKEYAAKTELQLNPQLKMIAYSYNTDVKKRGQRATPYEGLKLDELEFIADGVDKLPLVIFFIRSDKEVTKGAEAEAAMDIVEVQKIEWSNTATFEKPEVNQENTSKAFFAYDLFSSGLIATDKDTVNGVYGLEVDARIRPGGPKNYSIDGNSMRFLVKPQFILLRLWVVPGHTRSTSDAIAYAKLLPSHKPFTGLTLTLETSGGGGATLKTSDGSEKVTQIYKPHERKGNSLKLPQGTARWVLTYSGLTWSNLSGAQFQVTCRGPKDKVGDCVTASDSFDVNANVTNMLSDLLSDSDIQTKMNNPYNFKENDAIPEFLNGPIWNCFSWFDDKKPYVCGWMQFEIISYLRKRRHYNSEGDLAARLASMRGMNGIEYENYHIYAVHAWAGFFLSGKMTGYYKALDPWWEQRWVDPSFNKPENLMTMADEMVNLTKLSAAAGAVAAAAMALGGTLAAGAAGGAAAAGGVLTMLIMLKGLLVGMTLSAAAAAAGVTDFMFSSAIKYNSEASVVDNTILGFPEEWLIGLTKRLDQQDLNKWRKP